MSRDPRVRRFPKHEALTEQYYHRRMTDLQRQPFKTHHTSSVHNVSSKVNLPKADSFMVCAFNGRIVPIGKIHATLVSPGIVNASREYLYIQVNKDDPHCF